MFCVFQAIWRSIYPLPFTRGYMLMLLGSIFVHIVEMPIYQSLSSMSMKRNIPLEGSPVITVASLWGRRNPKWIISNHGKKCRGMSSGPKRSQNQTSVQIVSGGTSTRRTCRSTIVKSILTYNWHQEVPRWTSIPSHWSDISYYGIAYHHSS